MFSVPNHAGGWNQSRTAMLFITMRCEILFGYLVMISHTRSDHWSCPAIANFSKSRYSIRATSLSDCLCIVSCSWSVDLSLAPKPYWSGAITLYPASISPGIIFLRSRELVGVPCTSRSGVPLRSPRSIYLIFCHWKSKISRYPKWSDRFHTVYCDLGALIFLPT
mgnify:CR=1 FL=1